MLFEIRAPPSSLSGFLSLPTFRTLLREPWFWSEDWSAWLGLTTITDLFEGCFWFFSPVSLSTWLLIIQLLWTMRLSLPSSLASRPINPYFLESFSFSFFASAYFLPINSYFLVVSPSLGLRAKLVAEVSFIIFESPICPTCLIFSWEWAWAFKTLILSCSRSLMRCSFLTYSGVSETLGTSVLAGNYIWVGYLDSPFPSSMLLSAHSTSWSRSSKSESSLFCQPWEIA